MTAVAVRTPRTARRGGLTGTRTLVRFALRRDRVRLPVWVLSAGLLTVYSVVALQEVYPDAEARQQRAALMENPAAIMLGGPGFGVRDYTIGAMVANELGLTVMVVAAIMSVLLVVRHTRAEEEAGRADLVRAGAVGRRAQLTATLVVVALADLAVAAVLAAGLVGAGLGSADTAELRPRDGADRDGVRGGGRRHGPGRRAHPSGLGRGPGSAGRRGRRAGRRRRPRAGWQRVVVVSPIAWAQQTRAFVDLRWWPLGLSLLAVGLLVVLGLPAR